MFHSPQDGYRGVSPLDERVLTSDLAHRPPYSQDGLFYRSDGQYTVQELQNRLTDHLLVPTVQDYQYWTEAGWKTQHGSYKAVERFSEKLDEEIDELAAAVILAANAPHPREDLGEKLVLEAGDVLWCTTALACALTTDIDTGFKNLLFRYVMGVQHLSGGQPVEPPWRSAAAQLATKYGQLTLDDVEVLLAAGFEPLPSPAMNIYDPHGFEDPPTRHLITLKSFGKQFVRGAQTQFGREPDQYMEEASFSIGARAAGELAAQIYLETAFIATHAAGEPFRGVIRANVNKVSGRIATNAVDRGDPGRTRP